MRRAGLMCGLFLLSLPTSVSALPNAFWIFGFDAPGHHRAASRSTLAATATSIPNGGAKGRADGQIAASRLPYPTLPFRHQAQPVMRPSS